MLTLIARVQNQLDFESNKSGYEYVIVIYIDGKRQYSRQPSINFTYQQYPKGHLTTENKLQAVDALYKLTEDTEGLKEFWESL